MNLPFTVNEFMQVFAAYNAAIGPAPILLALGALAALVLTVTTLPWRHRATSLLLGLLWAWTGIVYHIGFFAALNPPAYGFGALFIAGAAVFVWTGTVRNGMRFEPATGARGVIGALLMLYGLAIYPVLGLAFGHTYPEMPTFGAPCPTTIFTIGLLFWLSHPIPRHVLVAPIIWSFIGGTAAFSLGVPEDYGLIVAGLAALILFVVETVQRRSVPARAT